MVMMRLSQRLPGLAIAAMACIPPRPALATGIDADLGGFVKFAYAAEQPSGRPLRAENTLLDGEIHLDVNGETDTGVTYGGRLRLLPAANPRDNGTFAEIGWAWGEIRIGDYGGAAKELSVAAPTIGIGQIDGDLDRFGGPSALIAPYALTADDSTRLTYFSPAILGFRFGLSYAPELSRAGIEIVPNHAGGVDADRDVVEFALSSARDLGDATVTTGAAYVTGGARAGVHLHDLDGGSIGSKLAWNGLTLGAAFVYDGAATLPADGRPGHVSTAGIIGEINAGATYQIGRWGLGASWAHDYRKATPSTDIAAAGIVYRVADGATIAADIAHFTEPVDAHLLAGNALIVETALSF
jgi:hypothetical protein